MAICSGITGLELGIRIARPDYRSVVFVERDAYSASVIVARMADQTVDKAPIWDDLKTFDGKPWRGLVDCVTAGYPCQPWSIAGLQKGVDDPRHLFPDIVRIIEEVEPEWCFFENVGNHLRFGFREVKSQLEDLHFTVEAGLFSSEIVGAPHIRQRLFILAHHNGQWESQSKRRIGNQSGRTIHTSKELGNSDKSRLERYQSDGECANQRVTWRPSNPLADSSNLSGQVSQAGEPDGASRGIIASPSREFGEEPLADTGSNGRRGRNNGDSSGQGGTLQTSGRCGELVNSKSTGEETTQQSRQRHGTEQTDRYVDDFQGAGDRRITGTVGNKTLVAQEQDDGSESNGQGKTIYERFGIFPPRPSRIDQWQEVISEFANVKPAICRVVDGIADRLDEYRYRDNRLRSVGNCVSPMVAALAWTVLSKRIKE